MKKSITIPYNFTPRDYQLEFIHSMEKTRRGVMRWHRRCGKDKLCFNYLAKKSMERVGLYLYIFENGTEAERAVWNNTDNDGFPLLHHYSPDLLARDDCNINNNKMQIKLPNGSIFRCVGGADPDTLRGANAMGVIFSEYAFCNPAAWEESISPMLAANGGWVIFNSTPSMPGDHFEKICQVAKNNPRDWTYSEYQTYDSSMEHYTGIVPASEIEILRQSGIDEDKLMREYGCLIDGAVQGSYYAECISQARKDNRIGCYPYSDHLWVDTFWDLGKGDDTVIWFRQMDGAKVIWFDYYANSQQSLAHYVEVLANKGYRYRDHVLPWDGGHGNIQTTMSNQEVLEALMLKAGVRGNVHVTTKAPVQDGINAVRSRFRRYYFDQERCNDGLMHIEGYHRRYNNTTRSYGNEPVHDIHSHAADALRTEGVYEVLDTEGGSPHGPEQSFTLKTDYDPFR